MAKSSLKPEKDFIRSAFRTLNLQVLLALVMVFIVPYVVFFHFGSYVFAGMNALLYRYSESIFEEYLLEPNQAKAMELALKHESVLVLERFTDDLSESGVRPIIEGWYTDGSTIITIEGSGERPSYKGFWNRFKVDQSTYLMINPADSFFVIDIHSMLFLIWVSSPFIFFLLLFFMTRQALYPMRWVQSGINELTKGNLNYLAPNKTRRDRNNSLATKFNIMTLSLRELIQSKDQLIMDVSHELRSPITRMKVALEMLPADKNIGSMHKSINKLEEIITTILESKRINLHDMAANSTECNLTELIQSCIALTKNSSPEIKFSYSQQPVIMRADQSLLKLLMHNIIENAQKYSLQDSKPIEINLSLEWSQETPTACINVSDDGVGLAEADLKKVFELFYKVAQERGFNSGYGLGLSLCKRIVELHHGSIELKRREVRGLEVVIRLPCDFA